MLSLTTPVADLPGVGPTTASKLRRLGILRAVDVLSHFPIRHEDLRRVTPIAQLRVGQTAVVRGRLQLIQSRRGWRRRRLTITEALLTDHSGTVKIIWFNQPYLATSFRQGDELFAVGKLAVTPYGQQLQSPLIERVGDRQLLAGRILPVYRAAAGLTQRQIRLLMHRVLPLAESLSDWLPEKIRTSERLVRLPTAIHDIHFPPSPQVLARSLERLKFGELLLFSLAILRADQLRTSSQAAPVPFNKEKTAAFVRSLPFTLTNDQRRAAWEILKDLTRKQPMNRLLEGDVGSGKTAVAAVAAHGVASASTQTALLAPTDILARQHYETLKRFFSSSLRIGLLTRTQREAGNQPANSKRSFLKLLADGRIDVVVGTHALLTETVNFHRLTLVVVDEQQRFGVEQRHALQLKGANGLVPHLLSMTATPIPRTLALSLYGDLTLSFLRQLPPGRQPIATAVVAPQAAAQVWQHVQDRAAADEQTYVVCPLIEESDELGVAAATTEYERLRTGPLVNLTIGMLHGKLPAKEKTAVLQQFAAGSLDVLVATPVVEVGVDVPNATTMVILGAERFGLAQLHQLRGRVGRSAKPSSCFLLTESDDSEVRDRLAIVERTTDGFALAEEDLRRRGPGDLYGIRQSGLPAFRLATLTDLPLMKRAHDSATSLLQADPDLAQHRLLARKAQAFYRTLHRE
ncbi:MAG: ATP-dependent DNA helicase RecG [Candidatus Kerfeldbacteria bacterium]|nr:ATP-dependent DNA helicase RecG [Candidatus Kerfeldbacteria bacterium]